MALYSVSADDCIVWDPTDDYDWSLTCIRRTTTGTRLTRKVFRKRTSPLDSPVSLRTRAQVLRTLCRLAETQQNLPVPITVEERLDLRAAFRMLTLCKERT